MFAYYLASRATGMIAGPQNAETETDFDNLPKANYNPQAANFCYQPE